MQIQQMLFTIAFVCLLLKHTEAALNANLTAENALVVSLLTGYRKDVRPDDVVTVTVTLGFRQTISLDEKNRIMTSSLFIGQQWNDPRLLWTPSVRQDIEVIMMNAKNLWLPDTYITNSADTDGYMKLNSDFTLATVKYTGDIYMVLPATGIKTRCDLDARDYPFDTQTCKIKFTPWTNAVNRVKLDVVNDNIDFGDYTENPVWKLVDTDVKEVSSPDRIPFEDSENLEIEVILYFKRKPLFYMINSVFPCLLLNILALFSFFIDFRPGIAFCMVGFLTFSVYSLRISTDLPIQSDFLPKITIYFIISIAFNLVVIIWHLFRSHYDSKPDNLPKFLEKFCNLLVKVFCWCYPPDKKKDSEGKKKDDAVATLDVKPPGDGAPTKIEEIKNKEAKKDICEQCDRCEACKAEQKKDKDKEKRKKEVKKLMEALNYLFLIIAVIVQFVYQMALWLSLGK